MPGALLSPFNGASHLFLTLTTRGWSCYHHRHFKDEETEAQSLSNLLKITLLVNLKAGIRSQVCLTPGATSTSSPRLMPSGHCHLSYLNPQPWLPGPQLL